MGPAVLVTSAPSAACIAAWRETGDPGHGASQRPPGPDRAPRTPRVTIGPWSPPQPAPANASYEAVDGVLYSKDHTGLVAYPAAKGSGGTYTVLDGTTRIEPSALFGAALTGIVLPDSLRSIGNKAFSGSGLESVVLPKGFQALEESAFWAMPSLARVDLGGTKTIGEEAFFASRALRTVDFRADLGRLNPAHTEALDG